VTEDAADGFGILECEKDTGAGALVRRPRGDVLTLEKNLTIGHLVPGVAHYHVRQSRLTGTVRSHQRVHFAFVDHQVNAAQNLGIFGLSVKIS
jgi:D-tyrosyl-tRNA(Tyr) deacylase